MCPGREAKGELGADDGRGGSASLRLFVEDVVTVSCTRFVAARITTFKRTKEKESREKVRMAPFSVAKRRDVE